jgi:hypothetical protein
MGSEDPMKALGRLLAPQGTDAEAFAESFAQGRPGGAVHVPEAVRRPRGVRGAWSWAEGAEPAADAGADQAQATESAIAAEVEVLGRTRAQASEHVRALARDAGARQGSAYANRLVAEYARALRGGGGSR